MVGVWFIFIKMCGKFVVIVGMLKLGMFWMIWLIYVFFEWCSVVMFKCVWLLNFVL